MFESSLVFIKLVLLAYYTDFYFGGNDVWLFVVWLPRLTGFYKVFVYNGIISSSVGLTNK